MPQSPASARPARERRRDGVRQRNLLVAFWLGAFVALYLLPFVYAIPFADGVRDIAIARAIARGEVLPLLGPVFGSSFHLGPVLYYLQALPLLLGLPTAAVPVFLGLLASSKFALAYGFGRALVDHRFGLCFAAALSLPGWAGLDFFNTTTPLLLPAVLLALAWLSLIYLRSDRQGALLTAALVASLAIHVHPSALISVLIAAALCLQHALRRGNGWALALAVLAACLPMLPALLALLWSGPQSLLPSGQVVVVEGSGRTLLGIIEALRGYALGGPLTTLRTLGSAAWGPWAAGTTLLIGMIGLALTLARACGQRDRLAQALLLLLLIVAVAVIAARASTPWYFMHSVTLVHAAALAYGWSRWQASRLALPVLALLLAGLQCAGLLDHLRRGEGGFPTAELMDIRKAHGERGPHLGAWLSVRHWPRLPAELCPRLQHGELAVHGPLAALIDEQGGLAISDRCSTEGLRLGGTANQALAGLPRAVWTRLGWPPLAKIGRIGLFEVTAALPTGPGRSLADPRSYPMRIVPAEPPSLREHRIETGAGAVLVISRLSGFVGGFEVESISANGAPVPFLHRDAQLQAFRAPDSGAERVIWSLQLSSSFHDWISIVGIDPPAGTLVPQESRP